MERGPSQPIRWLPRHVDPPDAAAAPPVAGRAGVRGDSAAVLLQAVQAGAADQAGERLAVEGVAQGPGEGVLRQVEWGGQRLVEGVGGDLLAAAQGAYAGQPGAALREAGAREAGRECRRVLAQDDGAGEAFLVLAGGLVEEEGGDLVAGERQRQGEPGGSRPDDDHRVHGVASRGASGAGERGGAGRELAAGARCAITERMQPIAAVRVKRRKAAT